jgi:lipid-A-disaccharide synthase
LPSGSNIDRKGPLLVVAGEGSGDAMAAPVVRRLSVAGFGLGGPRLRDAGVELLGDVSELATLGIGPTVRKAPAIARAAVRLLREIGRRRPRAALLAGYSEFNTWLGARLRARGTRVLWYGAPQVWAWRPGRAPAIRRACDRLAVVLPFEQALWRGLGADARYVGHPALGQRAIDRDVLRARLGFARDVQALAVLPGSREREVARHLMPMLDAVDRLGRERSGIEARLFLAPSLPLPVRQAAAAQAERSGVPVLETPGMEPLSAFDAAIVASGTATLECAVHGVPPLIVYRTGPVTGAVARRALRVPHIGLPNLLLGARVFPEFYQEDVSGSRLAASIPQLLDLRAQLVERCAEVRELLVAPLAGDDEAAPADRVARWIGPWLD